MAATMLVVSLATLVLLAAVYLFVARGFPWRHVRVHSDTDLDPILAVRDEDADTGRRIVDPTRFAIAALLLGLALTTFVITLTVEFTVGLFWAVIGIGLLYAALVLFEGAGLGRAGAN